MLDKPYNEYQLKSWSNYQQSNNNNAIDRIKIFKLKEYGGKNKTLLDVGSNNGEFPRELSSDFNKIYAVEPFVEPISDLPNNVTWIKKTFKEFTNENIEKYDVVLSLAMTIQAKENDNLSEEEIAERFFNLVKSDGILLYETQKLAKRIRNQEHVNNMVKAFTSFFGDYIKSGNARAAGARKFYIFKKK